MVRALMYAEFFEFRELPFNNTPDPRFFYSTPDHEEALASLIYAVKERKGFVLLTGEVGAGKTLVTRVMLHHFGTQIAFATIHHAVKSPRDLMESICTEFDLPSESGASPTQLVRALHDYLLAQFAQNIPVVLVLDEAQNLSVEGFEQLRMIGNLEADDAKLLQIAIVGQPELQRIFQSPSLHQLQQRIFRAFHLPALNRETTEGYINHRLSMVTDNPDDIFDHGAIDAVYNRSRGLPRLINTICDNTLLSAYSADRRAIDAAFVHSVVAQMLSISAPRWSTGYGPQPALEQPPPSTPAAPTPYQTMPEGTPGGYLGAGSTYAPVSTHAPVSMQQPYEELFRSLERVTRRVEDVEARLRRRAATKSVAAARETANQHDAQMSAIKTDLATLEQEVGLKVSRATRRIATVEHRLVQAEIGGMAEAQALRGSLEESVRQARSIVGRAEAASQKMQHREVQLRELTATIKTVIPELKRVLVRTEQVAAQSIHAERKARATHDRLVVQTNRSSTLADEVTQIARHAASQSPPVDPPESLMRERFISAVNSRRHANADRSSAPTSANRVQRVLTHTRESLTDLRSLARSTGNTVKTPAEVSAEPPTARLAQQVEDLLEFIETGDNSSLCESASAPAEDAPDRDDGR